MEFAGASAPRRAILAGTTLAIVVLVLLGSTLVVAHPASDAVRTAPALAHTPSAAVLPRSGAPGSEATPSSSGVGTVVDTLDLPSNRLLPGNQQLPVQSAPQMVLFDPANGDFYVRGSAGATLTVVNASSDAVLTALSLGYGGSAYIPNVPTMALDPVTGALYETNPSAGNIGVVSTSSNTLATNISVGGGPGGIVFDPATGDLFTSNWVNGTVTAISGATNAVVATIAVGREPGAILYDPLDQEVFVSNFDSGNVSVIDAATDKVVANPVTGIASDEPLAITLNTKDDLVSVVNSISGNVTVLNGTTNNATATVDVGSVPTSATYVASTDTLLVANGASNNVTVIQQPGNTIAASIAIGHGAQGAEADPVSGDVYIADYGANSVAIVDPSNNTLVATISTNNFPEDLGVDTATGNVYVANGGTSHSDCNLTEISGTTSASIASVPLQAFPTGLTAAPNGKLYAIDSGGLGAYIIPGTTNRESGIAPADSAGPYSSAYDAATGDLYIASDGTGTVNVVTATGGAVATLELGFDTQGLAYDPANGNVYVSNYYSGNVTVVDGATETVRSVFTVVPYDSLGAEIYDPVDHAVYVADFSYHNVTVVNGAATNGSIQVGNEPTSFAYDPRNDTIFVANYGSSNISVINASTNRIAGSIPDYFGEYLAYDAATNALFSSTGENGDVTAINATTYASLGSPLLVRDSVSSGGIAYSATTQEIYVSNTDESSISILSGAAVAPTNTTYPVQFLQTGLTGSTRWQVTVNGTPNSTVLTPIGFEEENGTYPFTVAAVTGYVATPSSGNVTVSGGPKTVDITFTTVGTGTSTYAVQFNETGLPQGTNWGVTLTPAGTGPTTATSPSPIADEAANGSYSFAVASVTGYTRAPASGTVVVTGGARYETIAFTSVANPLTASLAVAPQSLSLGANATLTTTASGGTPGYSYAYSGLPAGCETANAASLTCRPTSTGTFSITVTVTDSTGATAQAHATLLVSQPAGTTTSSSGSSNLVWEIGGGLIVLLALIFLLVWWRRRKSDPDLSPSAAGPPAPPGGA